MTRNNSGQDAFAGRSELGNVTAGNPPGCGGGDGAALGSFHLLFPPCQRAVAPTGCVTGGTWLPQRIFGDGPFCHEVPGQAQLLQCWKGQCVCHHLSPLLQPCLLPNILPIFKQAVLPEPLSNILWTSCYDHQEGLVTVQNPLQ